MRKAFGWKRSNGTHHNHIYFNPEDGESMLDSLYPTETLHSIEEITDNFDMRRCVAGVLCM
jgi:hypothetical protein